MEWTSAAPQIGAVLAQTAGSEDLARRHAAVARAHGAEPAELERNRDGYAADPLTQAALRFAHAALVTRGRVERREIVAMRRRGFGDEDLFALAALAAQVGHDAVLANFRDVLDR